MSDDTITTGSDTADWRHDGTKQDPSALPIRKGVKPSPPKPVDERQVVPKDVPPEIK